MGIESINGFLSKEFIYILFVVFFLVLWFFYKSNILKRLLKELFRNKWFFVISFTLAMGVILTMRPFTALVYYDEPQYIVSTQNFIENGNCLICSSESELKCEQSYLTPTGIGIFMIYSFFYSSDYTLFSLKISFLNIVMHLLSSVILFLISQELFKRKLIPYVCAILVLFAPFGLIHSSSPTAITLANTLFLLSIYGFILYFKATHKDQNTVKPNNNISNKDFFGSSLDHVPMKNLAELGFFVVFCLVLLSTIRVEFVVILLLVSLYFLIDCYKYYSRDGFKKILKMSKIRIVLFIFTVFVLGILGIFFNWYQSAFFYTRANLPLFDWGDVIHYFTSSSFVFLNLFLIVSVFIFFNHYTQILRDKNSKRLFGFLMIIFIFYLCFFSIKNTGKQFRYLIPVTSIYILLSSPGITYVFERFFGKGALNKGIVSIVIILLCLHFVLYAYAEKENIIKSRLCEVWLIEYVLSDEFKALTTELSKENRYFFSTTPFLFEITDVKNYTGDFNVAFNQLDKGNNIYYLRNYFRSDFDEDDKFKLDYFETSIYMCPQYGLAQVQRIRNN